MAQQAVFRARNQQLLLRADGIDIRFVDGEFRTADPTEIQFLLGVVRDSARDQGVVVHELPSITAVEASHELGQSRSSRGRQKLRVRQRIDLDSLTLSRGPHVDRSAGVSIVEAAALVAGESHTDRPESVSTVLATFLRSADVWLSDQERQRFVPLIPRLVDTAGSAADEQRRAFMLADFAGRSVAAVLLGEAARAPALARQQPVANTATALTAAATLRVIAAEVAGARLGDAIVAAVGVVDAATRLEDAEQRAGQARAHATWTVDQARQAETRATTARAAADDAARMEEAIAHEVDAALEAVSVAGVQAEAARVEVTWASAAAQTDARVTLDRTEADQVAAETHAVAVADTTTSAVTEARTTAEQASAAAEVANMAIAARNAGARAARAQEAATTRLAELVATEAAAFTAIAAGVGEREVILDEMLRLVERVAAVA